MEKNLFFGSRYLLTLPSKIKSGNCDKATKNVTIINKYNCNYALGYSESGCRLLKCFEMGRLNNINTLILISPSFSTSDLGTINIQKAITNLKNTRVILIDTDIGYAGSDSQYQWGERTKLKEAIQKNNLAQGSEIIFLKGADHMITDNIISENAVKIIKSKL